jgi:hypothetical protein
VLPLEVSAETIKRPPGLPLRHASNERAADNRTDGTEGWSEFISIVKPGATVLGTEPVLGMGARACRAASLPDGELARTAVDELPVNLEIDSAKVYLLVHLVSHAWSTTVSVHEPTVNGDPVTQAIGVHDHFPHLGWCDCDAGRGCDEAHGLCGAAAAHANRICC